MQQIYDIVAEVGFNLDEEGKRFGNDNRMVSLNCFDEDGQTKLGFAFSLTTKPDSRMYLSFPLEELMAKLVKAIYEAEH